MPPSDPPDRNQVADAIDRFINDVEGALGEFALLCPERGAGVPEDPWLAGDPEFVEWRTERTRDAEASVERARRTGRDLARDLNRVGVAPEPVIQVLVALKDFPGRYASLAVRWPKMVLQFDGLRELLVVGEAPGDLHGVDARAGQGGAKASRGVRRKRIWVKGKQGLRNLLAPMYRFGDAKLRRFIAERLKVGDACTKGRGLLIDRDAALAAAPAFFQRKPRRCPKCGTPTACPSCGRCGKCAGGPCSCGDAPSLEGDFLGL